ncbi:MAG: hypothetical protein JO122_16310 [Acetobacteraceae bacterium]|nr:hypothetical protein [Acetobacteraceae bacterium]
MSALDRPIPMTFFSSYAAKSKRQAAYTPRDLVELIRTTTEGRKDDLPWLKLARFGNRRTKENCLRHDINVLAITGIEADYDGGRITVDEALDTLEKQGITSILYTSPSHTEAAPRWRVLCPLSEEAKPAERRHLLGRLNGLFRGIFSRESWALSQSYYFGSVRNNPSHKVELIDGTPIDQHDDLDEIWIGPGNTENAGSSGDITGDERETAELIRRALTGEELHTTLTPLAARLIGRNVPRGIARELLRGIMLSWPESARNDRWKARYEEIDRLIESAVTKYQASAEARRKNNQKLCGLAMELCRQQLPSTEVRERICAQADALGIAAERAYSITEWAFRTACAEGAR